MCLVCGVGREVGWTGVEWIGSDWIGQMWSGVERREEMRDDEDEEEIRDSWRECRVEW